MNTEIAKHIIHPKSFGFFENQTNPLGVLLAPLKAVEEIISGVKETKKVCYVGSSCMYPDMDRACVEDDLGKGTVYTNNALFSYANLLAWQLCKKIADIYCVKYFVAIPSDVFGDPEDTHFIAQIMSKMHKAKIENKTVLSLPGLGLSIRHPIFDEDLNNCLEQLMDKYEGTDAVNIATPVSYARKVSAIANDIKEVVGFKGDIEWDAKYSDGQKFKVLSNDRLLKIIEPKFTPWMDSLQKAYERFKNET